MITTYYILLLISTFFFSFLGVGLSYWILSYVAVLDQPTERSNHAAPVVTGGGMAVVLVAIGFLVVANSSGALIWPMLLLLVVSFLDDRYGLSVKKRLGVHIIAVIIGLSAIKEPLFDGVVPMWIEQSVIGLLWLWFINLYNFMDGIDEMCVGQTSHLCASLVIVSLFIGETPRFISIDAVVILAAVIAFYPWNKHPARMFMGDAGSIPLGFVMGYLLFNLAAQGEWAAALILPAYYVGDATLTLVKRALAGKALLEAHSEHFYQKAVRAGRAHNVVVREVMLLNGVLCALACISSLGMWYAVASLAAAALCVAALLVRFSRSPRMISHEVPA